MVQISTTHEVHFMSIDFLHALSKFLGWTEVSLSLRKWKMDYLSIGKSSRKNIYCTHLVPICSSRKGEYDGILVCTLIPTIFPRRQIRCLSHNLAACCRLCYTSAFQRMKFIFRYVIVHALRSILVPQYMGL